jgi:hypothetical protein
MDVCPHTNSQIQSHLPQTDPSSRDTHTDAQQLQQKMERTHTNAATVESIAAEAANTQMHQHNPKKSRIIKWDEDTIAEHDKERGTR